ncbi:MAG: nitroreductase family protein [Saprospiraceae bacterium]|nr:nitroreductase family protein [Saprospiraceae bacterium]
MIENYKSIQYEALHFDEKVMLKRAEEFFHLMNHRRSVRSFSSRAVPEKIIENLIKTANTSPSGANKQPWIFCVITNPELKRKIRIAAEEEEYKAYHGGMSEDWKKDLSYLGTDWKKEFLEIAPALIVVFRKPYDIVNGQKRKNYYVQESVGLACGMLLVAIHNAGLVSLTHTPSPMNFLQEILARPENEKPFLLIPFGYPDEKVFVPDIHRKNMEQVLNWYK